MSHLKRGFALLDNLIYYSTGPPDMEHETMQTRTNFWRAIRTMELLTALSTGLTIWRVYGMRATMRYLAGLALATRAQCAFLAAMIHKTGTKQVSLADVMTLSRAATGAMLAGLVASGIRDRTGLAGKLSWSLILLEATAIDWLDGPLARLIGPSQLGGVMDIEADSWLTLWAAISAAQWADLPRWCLLPPIIRYLDPMLALNRGKLPRGGGPWWSRLTGTSQMVLFLAALAPLQGHWRERVKRMVQMAALPVSVGQVAAIVVLLGRNFEEE
ncbi:MAG TPA: CDP-alcohol phosphatidyltransferase family protein [Ktedonobacteraceae bacterium]